MNNIREAHKQALMTLLSNLTYANQTLAVYPYLSRSSSTYPFMNVLSAGLETDYLDSGTYDRRYKYEMHLVNTFESKFLRETEELIDGWEDVIVSALQSRNTRDNGAQNLYSDLKCTKVSELFNGSAIDLQDNFVIKSFQVELRTLIPF